MTEAECLDAFLSRDPQRIWQACGWVRNCWDREALRRLAVEKARIAAATKGVDLGGMLRPNAILLTRAFRRLDHAMGEGCFCTLLAEDDLADPRPLATAGRLDLTGDRIDPATGDGHLTCTCKACGTAYLVTEVMGYHYPWYRWERA